MICFIPLDSEAKLRLYTHLINFENRSFNMFFVL